VSPANMAEPIEMPFGLRARVDLSNRIRWGPDLPLEGAI